MSRRAVEAKPADRPRPGDDHAFFGQARGLFFGQTRGLLPLSGREVWERFAFLGIFGLIPYVTGRRHPAGRTQAAECALAPEATRRAVRLIGLGLPAVAALRLRRTMHPVR
ncbi:hypothetical protein [Streptomyces sp. NPDC001530]|uniref:hypothetical protein n=1 Tax=Streptomyces sp. NPDC001530 TaxID=3364582 RepID=UPI0036B4F2EE